MKWKTIFNPFQKFNDSTLLIIGILATIIGSLIGFWRQVSFDGIFDVHSPAKTSFQNSLLENSINIAIVFMLLFILGKLINKKTRAVDILNTSLIYRIPLYIIALFSNFPMVTEATKKILDSVKAGNPQVHTKDIIWLYVFAIGLLPFVIYSIVLIVNGFKTATNAKRWQHFLILTIVLLIGEFVSKRVLTALIY